MKGINFRWIIILLSVYIAAVLDATLAQRVAILGAAPSFLFLLIGQFTMSMTRGKAMMFGFLIGTIQGSLAGSDIQHFIAGGVIGGLICASASTVGFEYSLLAVVSVTTVASLIGLLVHVLVAPPPHVSRALLDTLIGAMYNGVLAVPVYALLHKGVGSSQKLSSL